MEKGPAESPAALFIFKADEKNQIAWDDASEIPNVRVELHRTRSEFLDALRSWNLRLDDPKNSFLLLYAHGAHSGVAIRTDGAELVTWAELRDALPKGVATLWLVGCSTQYVKRNWPTPTTSPVTSSLLVTTATVDWLGLIGLFRAEVDIDNIVYFDQMKSYLLHHAPKLGSQVEYLDAIGAEWVPFAETRYPEPSSAQKLTTEELQALWSPRSLPEHSSCGHAEQSLSKRSATVYRYACSVCHEEVMCSPVDRGAEIVAYCLHCSASFRDKKQAVRSIAMLELYGCPECLRACTG